MGTERASAEITLIFGQLPLPLKLFKASRQESVSFSEFVGEVSSPHPVGRMAYDKITGNPIPDRAGIWKGYELTKGDITPFTSEEIDALKARRNGEITRLKVEEKEDYLPEQVKSVYFAQPESKQKGQEAIPAIILHALGRGRQVKFVFVEGNEEREAVLRQEGDGLMVYVLYHADEVKERPAMKLAGASAEHVKAVEKLLSGINSELELTRRTQAVEDMVIAKKSGKKIELPSISSASVEHLIEQSFAMVEAKRLRK